MEQLATYLYCKHVYSNDANVEKFVTSTPVKVHSLTEEELQNYSPALIRNILNYSPANMELKLSLPNLFSFIRLNKIQEIMEEHELEYFF